MNTEDTQAPQNLVQSYRRVTSLAKTTSRMKNRDWYRNALDLNVQIHLYLREGLGLEGYLFIKEENHYEKLGMISMAGVESEDVLEKFVSGVIQRKELKKNKSLGVILYVADELSIASLGPEYQNPADLPDLSEMVVHSPEEILEDKTVSAENHSWRIFPYAGAVSGSEVATAVMLSRKFSQTMELFRDIGRMKNIPIVTSVLSAPLCAVASMPWFSTENENGTIAVYNYARFTLLAFFDKAGDLMMMRNMPHAAGGNFPKNIGSALMVTANAFELENPDIIVLSPVDNDTAEMIANIQKARPQSENITNLSPSMEPMKTVESGSDLKFIDFHQIVKKHNAPEEIPLEIVVATQPYDENASSLASNKTFTDFSENGWHLQEFLMPSADEQAMYPSASDMKMLRTSRFIKLAACLAVLGFGIWHFLGILQKTQSEEWGHVAGDTEILKASLQSDIKKYGNLDSALQDRSKAWVNMELISQLVNDEDLVVLSSVNHNVSQQRDEKKKQSGFEKTWVIEGFTNERGLSYLDKLSTREQIESLFQKVAELTGNMAYLTDVPQRDLLVNLKNSSNRAYQAGERYDKSKMFPLSFTMNITQTLSATDPLALKLK